MVLRVLAAHRPPLCFVEGGDNGSTPIFSGFLIDLLPTLLEHANIREVYTISSFVGSGGKQLSNGSWTGVMGELTANKTDMALFPLTLTAQRAQAIQHTTPYMDDGYGILVRTEQVDSGYSFLLPFQPITWALFLVAMFCTMLLIMVLDAVTRRARLHAFERVHGTTKLQKKRRRDKLMNHAIETVMMAVGNGAAPTSRSWSVKVVFVAWAIFCVIMLSAYTANLTANITVNQIGLSVTSLQDLAKMSQPFGVPADSSVSAYFSSSTDRGALALRHKMVEYNSTADGAEAVRDGKLSAFINDYATVQFLTQQPPCDLALASETIGSGSLVIGLPPNSTLVDALNTALLHLGEAGYLAELRRKWFVEASQCSKDDSSAGGDGRLKITQAWSVFLILAAGAVVATVVALLEVLYYRRMFAGVHELKQDLLTLGPSGMLRKRLSRSRSGKAVKFSESIFRTGTCSTLELDVEAPSTQPDVSNRGPTGLEDPKGAQHPGRLRANDSAELTIQPSHFVMDAAPHGADQQLQQPQQQPPKQEQPPPVRLTAQALRQVELQQQWRQQQQQKQTDQASPFAGAAMAHSDANGKDDLCTASSEESD